MRLASAFAALTLFGCAAPDPAAPKRPALDLPALLASDPILARIAARADEHRLQILVAEIATTDRGELVLRRSQLGDPGRYFYPASAIKTCAAVATLLELGAVSRRHQTPFTRDSRLTIEPLFDGDTLQELDPTNRAGGRITIGHEIRKLLLASDNQAFNRLYDFVGPRELNEAMHAAGYTSCRINHRLSEFRTPEQQRQARATHLIATDGTRETRAARRSDLRLDNADLRDLDIGDAHFRAGERIATPMSFLHKNAMSLRDLQDSLAAIVRPDVATGKRGFPDLTDADRAFLCEAMHQLPRTSANPVYAPRAFPDHYAKFLLPGLVRVVPPQHLRVTNKIGRAYGFSIENAFVEDLRTGRSFFLAAVLYTNPNRTLNDDSYAYEELADPFFTALGEALARALLDPD